jgi:serine/threonine-protein kinase
MGDVYLAVHKGPGGFYKLAVVKELRSTFAEDGTSLRMFLDEARLAARLSHPNVVQTNEVACEDGRHFMVMEYLEGKPFQHVLKRLGPGGGFPWAYRVHVLCEALKGLHYAHEAKDYDGTPLNVVHRDFTPHNIFVTYEGVVKVLDFGIAKAIDSHETRTGMIKGKFAYMAPEQAMGKSVDRRTDIYSAGVVLWEAITGRRMWPNLSEVQILMKVVKDDAPSPQEVNPDVPNELARICLKALAREPDDRYPSADAMRLELESFLMRLSLGATPAEIGALLLQGFEADRQRIRAIVDSTMRELRRASEEEHTVVAVPSPDQSGNTHSTIRPSNATPGVPAMTDIRELSGSTHSGLHTDAGSSLPAMPMPDFGALRPTPKKRGRLAAVAAVLAVATAGAAYFAFTPAQSKTPTPALAAPATQQVAKRAAEPVAALPAAEPAKPAAETPAASATAAPPVEQPAADGTPPLAQPAADERTAKAPTEREEVSRRPVTEKVAVDRTRARASPQKAEPEPEPAPAVAAVPKPAAPAPAPATPAPTTTPARPAPAPPATVMSFSGGMTRPMLLSGRDPIYTAQAREAKIEGTMVARCTITTAGAVTNCRILKSLPHMEKSVLDALYSRRYTPVMWEGKAVPVNYVFNIRLVMPK